MANWLEHRVQVHIEAPMPLVWELWSDLEQIPNWMKWIQAVEIVQPEPELSRWTLDARGLKLSWLSRTVTKLPQERLEWESVNGLSNRGTARFQRQATGCLVELSIAYTVPRVVGAFVDKLFLGRLVESTIQADLDRFRQYVLDTQADLATAESSGSTSTRT
ncbi:SRPBCC family protein [Oculatella sp. LEGE 06141]|uniref:SRPBCC family protein n=1 Tax=Oculatella sp. LEGE 06141 TaxID=1828648 RepID=UPI00187F0947|nr:SRPBCC family protein [Oculatella sp. LEGE 06141]MBE9180285.1 SRPBCC family protein [Oculatella sp. LEGE 06141]